MLMQDMKVHISNGWRTLVVIDGKTVLTLIAVAIGVVGTVRVHAHGRKDALVILKEVALLAGSTLVLVVIEVLAEEAHCCALPVTWVEVVALSAFDAFTTLINCLTIAVVGLKGR